MTKVNVRAEVEKYGVLPVINIPDPDTAVPLAEALIAGGLPLIEVTLRSAGSQKAISLIKQVHPKMTVGAGTVTNKDAVDLALSLGADYVVSPGYDPELVSYCIEKGVLIVPGCSTASEMQDAVNKGLEVLKFFPAELSGGLAALKLLSGPFPSVKFLPTGGITYANLGNYLSFDKIIACGGSFMATADQIANHDFEGITESCKKAVEISLGFGLAHVGINNGSKEEAVKSAELISSLFGFGKREGSTSCFAGDVAECMYHEKYGVKGHIGIRTNSIVRAMANLSAKGVEFDPESIKRDKSGNIKSIYFKEDICGFAWHIMKG